MKAYMSQSMVSRVVEAERRCIEHAVVERSAVKVEGWKNAYDRLQTLLTNIKSDKA